MMQETCREKIGIGNGLKSALLDSLEKCKIELNWEQFSLAVIYTEKEPNELGQIETKLIVDATDGFDTNKSDNSEDNGNKEADTIEKIIAKYPFNYLKGTNDDNQILVVAKLNDEIKTYWGLIKYILRCVLDKMADIGELKAINWETGAFHYFTENFQKRWILLGNYVDDFLQQHQLPESEILTALSAARYEGSESEARIYFDFDSNELSVARKISNMGEENRYINTNTYRMLRKLMEISKRKHLFLYAEEVISQCRGGTKLQPTHVIASFLEKIDNKGDTDAETKGLYVKFKGYMHWCVVKDRVEVITYRDGMYSINENGKEKEYLTELEKLKKTSESMEIDALNMWFAEDRFVKLIKVLQQQSHGTTVILSNDMKRFEKLCELNRGILLDSQPLFETSNNTFVSWKEQQILSLTEIDGALIMDLEGNGTAIGVIVDGKATIPGNTARGARYNTIVNFIETRKMGVYIAIIVSEDKMINVIWNLDGKKMNN